VSCSVREIGQDSICLGDMMQGAKPRNFYQNAMFLPHPGFWTVFSLHHIESWYCCKPHLDCQSIQSRRLLLDYSDMDSEKEPLLLCVCSNLFRMNWLVSMKRSTQFTKQISVRESSFGPGLSMHFSCGEPEETGVQSLVGSRHCMEWRALHQA
jgi:hypothetical protein